MKLLGVKLDIKDAVNIIGKHNPKEAAVYLLDKANAEIDKEIADRKVFESELAVKTDDELRVTYVPNVYQKDIYSIDYKKLWDNGIRLLSFDIDDTISDSIINKFQDYILGKPIKLPEKAVILFAELKKMGFTVTLLTNARKKMAEGASVQLGADGYIARAEKPETKNFEKMMDRFGFDQAQMAHIGNDICDDIAGGNNAGVTTCLVRRAGYTMKAVKQGLRLRGLQTKGHLVREELKERSIWRKHHKHEKGDQYYQLGEVPKYQCK